MKLHEFLAFFNLELAYTLMIFKKSNQNRCLIKEKLMGLNLNNIVMLIIFFQTFYKCKNAKISFYIVIFICSIETQENCGF